MKCPVYSQASAVATARPASRAARRAALTLGLAALLVATAPPSPASSTDATLGAIRAADLAVARIGYRLATANAALCDQLEPATGMVLHTPEQYAPGLRPDAVRYFRFDGPLGVEGVIAGSPAAVAGIDADDSLIALGDARFAPVEPRADATTAKLIAASRQLAELPPNRPLVVRGRRGGADYVRTLTPVPACRSRFELLIDPAFVAQADGEMVQVSSMVLERYPQAFPALIAHELAHNILRHRARLEARGVSYGMLSGFGRNVRYFRQSEIEADILSVSLLANAGYDPADAVRFWRAFGPTRPGGILRSRSHPRWQDRVATIEQTIRQLPTERPVRPAILASRDRPLTGDWESLLVRAR